MDKYTCIPHAESPTKKCATSPLTLRGVDVEVQCEGMIRMDKMKAKISRL